jgi:cation transport ATPase
VLLVDHLDRLLPGIEVAQRSRRIALESVAAGIGLSVLGMIAAAFGYLTPVQGALLQELIDVAVILNALRALRIVPEHTGRIEGSADETTARRPPSPTSTAA